MDIIGISCVSNLAAGISLTPLTEEEVLEAGRKVAKKFSALVTEIITNIN
jgi:purine-nucleoside phosphorylase